MLFDDMISFVFVLVSLISACYWILCWFFTNNTSYFCLDIHGKSVQAVVEVIVTAKVSNFSCHSSLTPLFSLTWWNPEAITIHLGKFHPSAFCLCYILARHLNLHGSFCMVCEGGVKFWQKVPLAWPGPYIQFCFTMHSAKTAHFNIFVLYGPNRIFIKWPH